MCILTDVDFVKEWRLLYKILALNYVLKSLYLSDIHARIFMEGIMPEVCFHTIKWVGSKQWVSGGRGADKQNWPEAGYCWSWVIVTRLYMIILFCKEQLNIVYKDIKKKKDTWLQHTALDLDVLKPKKSLQSWKLQILTSVSKENRLHSNSKTKNHSHHSCPLYSHTEIAMQSFGKGPELPGQQLNMFQNILICYMQAIKQNVCSS